jgi:potassium/hydrogen antiporter
LSLTDQIILLGGVLLLLSIFASAISQRLGMPLLLVFLILGMLAGEDGPGGIMFDDIQAAHLVGSLALAIILLDGGLRTEVASFRVGLRPAVGLATLGVVLTAAITGLVAHYVFVLTWLEALLLGAIVGSTDAAAVFSLLHSRGLELKQRVAATLEIESGSNDPMAIFLTIVLVEALAAGHTTLTWDVGRMFVLQMGLGAVMGLAGGRLVAALINRMDLTSGLYPLLALAGGLFVYGATSAAGGSGFLAIYLAGLVLGNRRMQAMHNIRRFHDGMAWLSQIGMFLMLGLLVTPSELIDVAPQGLLIAAVLMFLARPLTVWVCLLPFRFAWREQLYIAWVGLRGAVPIILALFPLLAGLDHADTFFNVAFFVVLVSLVVQGWSVAPAARLLGLEVPPSTDVVQRVELDIPGQAEYELVGYKLATDSPAVGRPAQNLPMPSGAAVAAVIRRGQLLPVHEVSHLEENDYLYIFAMPRALSGLDRLLVAVHAPARLAEHRFFGEFALNADAMVGDLATFYGFPVPPEQAAQTVGELIRAKFKRPVVGDRVSIASVEFVVREMEGERIKRVGLKLHPSESGSQL